MTTQPKNTKHTLDIHQTQKELDYRLDKLKTKSISPRNKQLIVAVSDHCKTKGLTAGAVLNHVRTLSIICEQIGKDLDNLSERDVRKYVKQINEEGKSERYRVGKLIKLKKAVQIIKNYPKAHAKYPKEVVWINTTPDKRKLPTKSWDDLITEDEVYKKIVRHANTSRNRLLLIMLRESGSRIGSIGNVTISQVEFRDHGFVLKNVKDKNGYHDIHFYLATPYLHDWLDDHPDGDNPDAPLFVCLQGKYRGQHTRYQVLYGAVRSACRKAGIKKPHNPHHFRHSDASITGLYMPTSLMEKRYNWVPGSAMPGHYQHVSHKQADNLMRKLRGLSYEELPKPTTVPLCNKCNIIAKIHTMRCPKCGVIVKMNEVEKEKIDEATPSKTIEQEMSEKISNAILNVFENIQPNRK